MLRILSISTFLLKSYKIYNPLKRSFGISCELLLEKKIENENNFLKPSFVKPEYWFKRSLAVDSYEWKKLRKRILARDNRTCRFCKIRLSKYMVVDHINGNAEDNSHDNLGLNCPACDAIRHCGFSEKKDLIELRISKLSQEEIVKKSCEFYIKNGKNPSYKDIDPHSKETHLTPIEIVKSSQKGEINDSNFKVFFTNQMDFSYLDFSYKSDIISPFKNEIQELEIKTSKHHFLKELNYQQKIAVLNQRKKVCVIAGPGCGKTKTIVSRAIHLIENEKINSENILLITFSKRAAGEIENRFSEIHFLNDISSLGIFNLHSFCYRLLRENHQFLNLKKEAIDVCDNRYQAYLFKKILKGLNSPLSRDNKEISSLLSLIRFCKVTEDLGFSLLQNDKLRLKSAIKYQQYLKKNELFDYSDLLIYTKNTLLEYFEVRQNYQNKFSHILVDEFQDINKIQWKIIELIAGKKNNLFLVGDPNQAIYKFQGADPDLIKSLKENTDWKNIYLNTNYRSTEKIIKESNNFIKQHASDFVPNFLECMKEPGAKVAKMLQVRSGDIVEEILLIKNREKLRFKDIAIIYRKNYLSTFFEEKLSIKKIPYEIINYDKFATRDEIKDVINFLKNIVDSENDFYIIESLKKFKGIKESVLLKLEEISRKNNISIFDLFLVYPEKFNIFSHQEKKMLNSFFEKLLILKGIAEGKGELQSFVKKIIKDFDYYFYLENKDIEGERINSVNNLIEIIGKWEKDNRKDSFLSIRESISEFINYFLISFDDSKIYKEKDYLKLSSVHQAKGLEFEAVFFVNLDHNTIPHESNDIREEKRIYYVGITRAKRLLYLCNEKNKKPSVFLN